MNRFYAFGAAVLPLLLAPGAAPIADKFLPTPEVTLRLAGPERPALLLINGTGVEAKRVVYRIRLWNVDNLVGADPLRIPDDGLAGLPPHETSAPVALFHKSEIRSMLKPGNRVVGTIYVHCGNCARGYSYRVYITYGEGGWFAETEGVTNGALFVPRGYDNEVLDNEQLKATLLSWITVEKEARIPIAPLGAAGP